MKTSACSKMKLFPRHAKSGCGGGDCGEGGRGTEIVFLNFKCKGSDDHRASISRSRSEDMSKPIYYVWEEQSFLERMSIRAASPEPSLLHISSHLASHGNYPRNPSSTWGLAYNTCAKIEMGHLHNSLPCWIFLKGKKFARIPLQESNLRNIYFHKHAK